MDDGCAQQHQQSNGGATVHHRPAGSTGNKIALHNNNNNNQQQQHHVGMQSNHQPPFLCSGCATPIVDQYLLKALDCYWHEDCLKCGCCDCRLGEVGSTLYTKANLILCKRDYLRMFGTSGHCAACCKPIPAFEMVMRAKTNVYHLDCFACQQCHQRFCVGDRFYLNENKILCEYDYEERLLALNMPSNNNASTQHIQRRVSDIHQSGDGAIGYDSQASQPGSLYHQQQLGYDHFSDGTHFIRSAPSVYQQHQQQYAANRQVQHLASRNNQHKHGSPSDGSSSGYGSPDSILLDER